MAKIKRNNFLDTVNEVFTDATREGVLHLYADGDMFTGRKISVQGKNLFHFGTTGYLGLEQDERLKRAAAEAIFRYGTQFPPVQELYLPSFVPGTGRKNFRYVRLPGHHHKE